VSSGVARAVVLLSGGLDSTTTLAIARAQGFDCYALTVDYGQRHRVELDAARRVALGLGAREHAVIPVDLRRFGGSALTADLAIPTGRDPGAMTDIPPTYVPARNTVFLALALAWAEALDAQDLFIGVNALDYSVDGAAVVWVRSPSWARPMPIEAFYTLPEGDYETVGVDPGSLQIGWRRVTGRVRHSAAHKRCVKIRLERGQELTISEDHSLFTVDPVTARPVTVKGAEIERGMPIVVPFDLSASADAWSRDVSLIDASGLPASGGGRARGRGRMPTVPSRTAGPERAPLPRRLPVSDELLYLIGLGLAERAGTGNSLKAAGRADARGTAGAGAGRPQAGGAAGGSLGTGLDRGSRSGRVVAPFRSLGLSGPSSPGETEVPPFFWDLSQRQRRVIVAGLWDGGGRRVPGADAELALPSDRLVSHTYHCLALDGIFPTIWNQRPGPAALRLDGASNLRKFVELYAARLHRATRAADEDPAATAAGDESTGPWESPGLLDTEPTTRLGLEAKTEISARGAKSVAGLALASPGLAALRVVDIEDVRVRYLYDLSVDGCENFVANGILAHNSGYPDCRPEYIEAFERMANLATKAGVEGRSRFRIHTPLIAATKAEIVRRARALGVDLGLTWSCYDPQSDGRPCGVCDACVLRRKGFTEAGVADPLS
jgi:7-cyano-7-deazaguanine synthase in queuosine biosynthesis